jgi:hypothetical protein
MAYKGCLWCADYRTEVTSNPVPEKTMFAQLRADLRDRGLSTPVGDKTLSDDRLYSYRYVNYDDLQIMVDGEWLDAVNIDFDFFEVAQGADSNRTALDYVRTCQAGQDETCRKWWEEEEDKLVKDTRDLPCFRPKPKGVI